jgi:hypothetical protein
MTAAHELGKVVDAALRTDESGQRLVESQGREFPAPRFLKLWNISEACDQPARYPTETNLLS